jgi:glycosyltransferase involved in cell wall biosynthesis
MELKKLIIIPVCNQDKLIYKNLDALSDLQTDILLVDDGSTDNTYEVIQNQIWLKYIKLEQNLGIGAAIINGYEYARDLEYDVIIILDLVQAKFGNEISELMNNINYGYDIVTSSRILENFNYGEIPSEIMDATAAIASQIKNITGLDITDPLSGIKAIRIDALKLMELTEYNHGLFLQLLIQGEYYGLTIIEIPSQSGIGFGTELAMYDDPLGLFHTLLETEKYLYSKNNLH